MEIDDQPPRRRDQVGTHLLPKGDDDRSVGAEVLYLGDKFGRVDVGGAQRGDLVRKAPLRRGRGRELTVPPGGLVGLGDDADKLMARVKHLERGDAKVA